MKDKIGFIAVGQAGGNIGRLLEVKGYRVLYINTSKEDLDTLTDVKYKYHIPEGEGCNKDRKKAKQLVINNFEELNQEISAKLDRSLLFVIFSSGGGTGSGVGPMLMDLLIEDNKHVGAITVIPGETESLKSHINAYECFCEMTEIVGLSSTFILDNNKNPDKLKINNIFVDMFTRFLDIPYKYKSERGNIDRAEIEETLKSHGMAIISVLGENNNSTPSLISTYDKNIFAPLEHDEVIKYIALSAPENIKISDLENAVGTPIDTFRTYNNNSTICLLAGLSYPHKRLEIIHKKVMDNKEIIKKNLSATSEQKLKNDINFLDEFDTLKIKKEIPKSNSKRDIMSKYLKN